MMNKNKNQVKLFLKILCLFFSLIFVFVFRAQAAPDKFIYYQGKLTDTFDVAVADGSYDFKFTIWDASSGGNCLWSAQGSCGTPTAKSIAVANGIFNAELGGTGDNALSLDFNSSYWLEVTVESDSAMDTRKKIGGAGFAMNSLKLDGQDPSYYLDLTNATNQDQIDHGSIGGLNDDDHTQYALLAGRDGDTLSIDQVNAYDAAGLALYDDGGNGIFIEDGGNVGIGTTDPSEQLEIAGNFELPNTTYTDQSGIIYKNGTPFLHNFNYGDNGTVTTIGENTFLGINAGNFTMGSTATQVSHSSYNVGIGSETLSSNEIGFSNVAVGYSAFDANTEGDHGVAIGFNALLNNTSGDSNVAVGSNALRNNTSGGNNVAVGIASLFNNTGSYNVAIGQNALYYNTSGASNIAIGRYAGRYTSVYTNNQTGAYNVFIGENTSVNADGDTNEIVIGYNAVGLGSNSVVLGNDSITTTVLKGNVGIGETAPDGILDVSGGSTNEFFLPGPSTAPDDADLENSQWTLWLDEASDEFELKAKKSDGNVISQTVGSGGGTSDHGALTGLTDDDHTQYLLADGTRALSGNWDAGSYEIQAQTFESDVATGTAPLTVASTTLVSNLNADLLDGQEGSYYLDLTNATNQDQIDHGSIGGLNDDDHAQYALLAGRDGDILSIDQVNAYDAAGLALYDDGGNGIFIEDGGNVGIGTTTPSAAFHVAGAEIIFGSGEGGTPSNVIIRGPAGSGTNVTGGDIYFDASNGTGSGGSGDFIFRTAASGSTAEVSYDATSSSAGLGTRTFSHTVADNADKLLIVRTSSSNGLVNTVTFGGTSLTRLDYFKDNIDEYHVEVWYLKNPSATTANVVVTPTNGSAYVVAGASSYYNVDQTNTFGTTSKNENTNGTSNSVTVSSGSGEMVVDVIANDNTIVSAGSGQTARYNINSGGGFYGAGSDELASGSSTIMSWTLGFNSWSVLMGVAIKPVGGAGGNALAEAMRINSDGYVGIGTSSPSQQLEITGNFEMPVTTYADQSGIIYKDGDIFFHDFNYGDNGTVTTTGGNTFLGKNAGNLTMGSTATVGYEASLNTFIGHYSGYSSTTGYGNSFMGYNSGYSITEGSYDTFVGLQAGESNTSGSENSFFGAQAGNANTSGSQNTFIGSFAGESTTISAYNTALGYSAFASNDIGYYNAAVGSYALSENTSGYNNAAMGVDALLNNTTGDYNSALGRDAGKYITGGSTANQTSENSLYLGASTKAYADGDTNEIVIGYDTTGFGSNTAAYGNSSIADHIFQSGNVGIGETSPAGPLDVAVGANTDFIRFDNDTGGTEYINFGNDTTDLEIEFVNDSEGTYVLGIDDDDNLFHIAAASADLETNTAFTIDQDGFVGIGTSSPDFNLQVHENSGSFSGVHVTNNDGASLWLSVWDDENVSLWNDDNTNMYFATNDAISMTLASSGNVGIGETSPDAKLEIHEDSLNGVDLHLSNNDGGTFWISVSDDEAAILWNEANTNMYFGTNDTARMTIDSSGHVGVRETNPGSDLTVGVNPSADALIGAKDYVGSGYSYLMNLETYDGADNFVVDDAGNVIVTTLTSNSTVYSNGGVLTNTNPSDARLKKDIESIDGALNGILDLNPVTFRWRDSQDDSTKVGFIAQEVQEIFPNLVGKNREYLGLYTTEFIPYLVKGMQEQNQEIEKISEKIGERIEEDDSQEKLEDFIEENSQGIAALWEEVEKLKEKMESFSELFQEVKVIAARASLNEERLNLLEMILGTEKGEPGDVEIAGLLSSGKVKAESVEINPENQEGKTIGVAEILPVETDEDEDGIDDETGSDGKSLEIKTSAVDEEARIFISPIGNNPVNWSIGEIVDKEGFSIILSDPVEERMKFNWWIVFES